MSRILIITPASRTPRSGNRVTANRWIRMLRSADYRVTMADSYQQQPCDLMIALHARRSATAVSAIRKFAPDTPVVAVLTGTDLYRDIHKSEAAKKTLELADRLVVLQEQGPACLPSAHRDKAKVIYQSVSPVSRIPDPLKNTFEICVSGHLRAVKDPFRAEIAVRRLPIDSRIRITHLGEALSEDMRQKGTLATERNARYRWIGGQPRWKARQLTARSRILVVSSKIEGGANVIAEAITSGTPVLASAVSGNIGMLGENYSGYFRVGDTGELRRLMLKAESDPTFLNRLRVQCETRGPLFTPQREFAALMQLMKELYR